MQLKRKKRSCIISLIVGLMLTLAACSAKSDVPSSSSMSDGEMVSLIWNLPHSSSVEIEHKLDRILEENPNPTLEEEKVLMKRLLAEQVTKLSDDELTRLQQKLREDRELQD